MRKFVLAEALFFCLVVGAAGGAYWGVHYSSSAAALRETRKMLCPSVSPTISPRRFPRACVSARFAIACDGAGCAQIACQLGYSCEPDPHARDPRYSELLKNIRVPVERCSPVP
jgi:hypothetical protein